jgi:hypothetical protein
MFKLSYIKLVDLCRVGIAPQQALFNELIDPAWSTFNVVLDRVS